MEFGSVALQSLCQSASCCVNQYKLIFGRGTRLQVEPSEYWWRTWTSIIWGLYEVNFMYQIQFKLRKYHKQKKRTFCKMKSFKNSKIRFVKKVENNILQLFFKLQTLPKMSFLTKSYQCFNSDVGDGKQ